LHWSLYYWSTDLCISLFKTVKLITMAASHDKLLSQMHLWMWNERPQTRGMYHANFNNLPLELEHSLPLKVKLRLMSNMKAIGLVKDVLDSEFFWAGRLYMFDAKTEKDKLSVGQKEIIEKLKTQGGNGMEIRSLESFKSEIDCILTNGCLTTEL